MRTVIACTACEGDALELRRARWRVVYCSAMQNVMKIAASHGATHLVCDLLKCPAANPRAFAGQVVTQPGGPAVAVRCRATNTCVRPLQELARVTTAVAVSVRDGFSLADELGNTTQAPGSASLQIVACFNRVHPAPARNLLTGLAVRGYREVAEDELARAYGVSDSTVRTWLRAARTAHPRLPSYPRMNASVVATHALNGREEGGLHRKQCARRAGFGDDKAFDGYLDYHFGLTLRRLVDAGGYRAMLEHMESWFAPPPTPGVAG